MLASLQPHHVHHVGPFLTDASDICRIAVVSLSHGVVRKHGEMVVRTTRGGDAGTDC